MKPDPTTSLLPRFLAIILVCLVTGLGGYCLMERSQPLRNLESLFPKDTLLVVEWENAGKIWALWRNSLLFDQKGRGTALKVLEQPEPLQAYLHEVDKLAGLYDTIAANPIVRSLINTRAALAILPDSEEHATQPFSLGRQWVLALQTDAAFDIRHYLDRADLPKVNAVVSGFQGESIVQVTFPGGEQIACWQRPGAVLCANEMRLLHRCIQMHLQRMIHRRAGLDLNPTFQAMRAQSDSDAPVFCYADLERLGVRLSWLQELIDKTGSLRPRQLALSQHIDGQVNRLEGLALINGEVMSAVTGLDHLPDPQGPLPNRLDDTTALVFWTNWLNAKEVWRYVVDQANEEVATLLTALEQAVAEGMGDSVDTFFDVFGQRIGVLINDQGAPYQTNQSLGCLAIEVRDREKVERLIKQLTAGLQVISVQSDAAETHTVMLAGGLLQPAYSLEKNRLLVADNMELIEQARRCFALDAPAEAQAQPGGPDTRGNLFVAVRPGVIAERIVPMLTMAAKENGERNRVFSTGARLRLRAAILPFLASLHGLKTCSLRGGVSGDHLSVEVTYTLQTR